ncbi:MAG: riboflavin synthase [Candidatus Gracilibacteria bacterium]|nr:riboflavin synthase [Candidatus Gracilibacteria bacterium]
MFSGIVEKKAEIISIENGLFTIKEDTKELSMGQSIAHDGACMTLCEIGVDFYKFFAMEETLKRTNFGTKKVGDSFNVEKSVRYGDRMDGHFVTGHIDTTGEVYKIDKKEDNSKVVYIKFPCEFKNLLVEKGSIAVNGVSLTLVEVGDDFFSISLIPYTLDITNLGELVIGSIVNLEFDILGKYVNKRG